MIESFTRFIQGKLINNKKADTIIQHKEGHRRKYQSNALYRHDIEVHNGVKQTYEARILVRERTLLPLSII